MNRYTFTDNDGKDLPMVVPRCSDKGLICSQIQVMGSTSLEVPSSNAKSACSKVVLNEDVILLILSFVPERALFDLFTECARDRDWPFLQRILFARKDCMGSFVTNGGSSTFLMYAAARNDCELLNLLLAYALDVNKQDELGYTACHYAALNKSKQALELLLHQPNIDVNLRSKNGNSALHIATIYCHHEIVKVLVEIAEDTIDVNVQDDMAGTTPLIWTATHNDFLSARLLLNHPLIDPNIVTKDGVNFHDHCHSLAMNTLCRAKLEQDCGDQLCLNMLSCCLPKI